MKSRPRKILPDDIQDLILKYYGYISPPKESASFLLEIGETSSKVASFVYTKLTNDALQVRQNNCANAVAFLTFVSC